MLQETWLLDCDMSMLNKFDVEFHGQGVSSIDHSQKLLKGRPHGGIAILWRKSLFKNCNIEVHDKRVMSLKVQCNDVEYLFVNVYLPYCSDKNLDEYLFYLGKLKNIIDDASCQFVYLLGDYNADVTNMRDRSIVHKFGQELAQFTADEGYSIVDVKLINDNNSYTFYCNSSNSWIDHIICPMSSAGTVCKVEILYDFISSDHHPLYTEIVLHKSISSLKNNVIKSNAKRIPWGDLTQNDIDNYRNNTDITLGKVNLCHDLLLCDNPNCKDVSHTSAITNMYDEIVVALNAASDNFSKSVKCSKQVLGWNEYCKIAHADARTAYVQWRNVGKPRQGIYYHQMKQSRSYFKLVLRKCKTNSSRLKANKLAEQLLTRDDKAFWKEIKKCNGNDNIILANSIDGVTGATNIADQWNKHYSTIFNSSTNNIAKPRVQSLLSTSNLYFERFTVDEIMDSVKSLKGNKSPGMDNIYSEHYKHAGDRLYVLLALLFNAIVVHSFLPEKFMDSMLVPIVKDKKGNITRSDNYRPLAITTMASKLFELLILDRYSTLLKTTDNQFGFKSKHSTDMCVFSLKYIVEYYKSQNSPVYLCFLDLSKAFDKVNHWMLFEKLIQCKIPVIIVRLIVYWYCNQKCYTKWGNVLSTTPFCVSNGVRQGGILSPFLFNIFTNQLSILLNNAGVGCYINSEPVNHLFYADDSVLLAPTSQALQKLLNICQDFAKQVELCYNTKKTFCIAVLPQWLKNIKLSDIYLNNSALNFVPEHKYLGILITESMSDDSDIRQQTQALYARGNTLIAKFRNCDDTVKEKLFSSYCNSLYGGNLWVKYTTNRLNRLRYAHCRIFTSLFKHESKTLADMQCNMVQQDIDTVDVIIRKIEFSLYTRIFNSTNNIIKSIICSDYFYDSNIYKKWMKDMF